MTHLLTNLLAVLRAGKPESEVPLRWLLRSSSAMNRSFRSRAVVVKTEMDEWQEVAINGEVLLWPKGASIDSLLHIASELQTPHHPNHYLWGPTQIKPGDVALDIGACEGCFAAQASGRGAEVIAVEPSRTMCRLIPEMFRLRKLAPPRIAHTLLGPVPREVLFAEHPTNPGKSKVVSEATTSTYPVKVIPLDQLIADLGLTRLDFIKCDAEGADVDIIKSGAATLQRFHPKLALCTYHGDRDYCELYEFLRPLGYKIVGKGFLHTPGKLRVIMLHAT